MFLDFYLKKTYIEDYLGNDLLEWLVLVAQVEVCNVANCLVCARHRDAFWQECRYDNFVAPVVVVETERVLAQVVGAERVLRGELLDLVGQVVKFKQGVFWMQ